MSERPYRPGEDDKAVLKLRAKVWGADHSHTDESFFKWLFQDCPFGMGSGVVSIHDDVVVGFAGLILRPAQIGTQTLLGCQGVDFMVDPDTTSNLSRVPFRIIKAHSQRTKDLGADFAVSFPNDSSVRLQTSKHFGYQILFKPQMFVRPLPCFRFSSENDDSLPTQLLKTSAARLTSVYSSVRSWRRSKDITLEDLDHFDDRFDELNTTIMSDGKLHLDRGSRYLNWRYTQHPIYQYKILAASSANQLLGYIVVSPRQVFGTLAGLICELSVAGNEIAISEQLINAAAKVAQESKISILVDQQHPNSPYSDALVRCGFIKVPQRFNPKQFRMVAREITSAGHTAMEPHVWSFSWGDMDVV
ncbi:hypothetical protein [Sneathiella litorea]|uniref:Uncharacterized protein n=1 Tax=Sneathiella litorea TaxID=2606216 RepID=A0A6L8WBG1_9PROT|nr:hypothetical protein [Sneathiella litorea]MZR32398.1 hypothetical protein [Sneathiella litorea]